MHFLCSQVSGMQIFFLKKVSLTVILWRRFKSKGTAECGDGGEPGLYVLCCQIKLTLMPCMEVCVCVPTTRKGLLWVCGQPGLKSKIVSQNRDSSHVRKVSWWHVALMKGKLRNALKLGSWMKKEERDQEEASQVWLFLWSARCPVQRCPPRHFHLSSLPCGYNTAFWVWMKAWNDLMTLTREMVNWLGSLSTWHRLQWSGKRNKAGSHADDGGWPSGISEGNKDFIWSIYVIF